MPFKKEVRIIAWDDCDFSFKQKCVTIVGVVFRGGQYMDGLLSTTIEKDGLDATKKISGSILKSRHYDQLSIIMLDGITFAGFNLVDVQELRKKTKLPVIVVQRDMPNMKKFLEAMRRVKNYEKRKNIVKHAGRICHYKTVYYQKAGLSEEECRQLIDLTCVHAKIPEPIRVAHLIASGLSRTAEKGFTESRGRA